MAKKKLKKSNFGKIGIIKADIDSYIFDEATVKKILICDKKKKNKLNPETKALIKSVRVRIRNDCVEQLLQTNSLLSKKKQNKKKKIYPAGAAAFDIETDGFIGMPKTWKGPKVSITLPFSRIRVTFDASACGDRVDAALVQLEKMKKEDTAIRILESFRMEQSDKERLRAAAKAYTDLVEADMLKRLRSGELEGKVGDLNKLVADLMEKRVTAKKEEPLHFGNFIERHLASMKKRDENGAEVLKKFMQNTHRASDYNRRVPTERGGVIRPKWMGIPRTVSSFRDIVGDYDGDPINCYPDVNSVFNISVDKDLGTLVVLKILKGRNPLWVHFLITGKKPYNVTIPISKDPNPWTNWSFKEIYHGHAIDHMAIYRELRKADRVDYSLDAVLRKELDKPKPLVWGPTTVLKNDSVSNEAWMLATLTRLLKETEIKVENEKAKNWIVTLPAYMEFIKDHKIKMKTVYEFKPDSDQKTRKHYLSHFMEPIIDLNGRSWMRYADIDLEQPEPHVHDIADLEASSFKKKISALDALEKINHINNWMTEIKNINPVIKEQIKMPVPSLDECLAELAHGLMQKAAYVQHNSAKSTDVKIGEMSHPTGLAAFNARLSGGFPASEMAFISPTRVPGDVSEHAQYFFRKQALILSATKDLQEKLKMNHATSGSLFPAPTDISKFNAEIHAIMMAMRTGNMQFITKKTPESDMFHLSPGSVGVLKGILTENDMIDIYSIAGKSQSKRLSNAVVKIASKKSIKDLPAGRGRLRDEMARAIDIEKADSLKAATEQLQEMEKEATAVIETETKYQASLKNLLAASEEKVRSLEEARRHGYETDNFVPMAGILGYKIPEALAKEHGVDLKVPDGFKTAVADSNISGQ